MTVELRCGRCDGLHVGPTRCACGGRIVVRGSAATGWNAAIDAALAEAVVIRLDYLNSSVTAAECAYAAERIARAIEALRRPDVASEWRDRPPTIEEVRAHAEAHSTAWGHTIWAQWIEGAVPAYLTVRVVDGGMVIAGGCRDGYLWRPCTSDGTPVAWPAPPEPGA